MEPHPRFEALSNFFSPETQSEYVAGLQYTARNPKLMSLAAIWEEEGKIRWIEEAAASAGGVGTVV